VKAALIRRACQEGEIPVSISKPYRPATLLTSIAACALLGPALAVADAPVVNEKFSDLEPAIKMLRQEVGQDRREIVKKNMLLTGTESARFWPLYDQYRADMSKVGDRRVRLITDFAANRDSMTEDEAQRLTQERFDIEREKIKVKEEYVRKMSKDLSSRTVARFFQIDAKLDAAVDAELAARIPLAY
jgi:hypothetical protein